MKRLLVLMLLAGCSAPPREEPGNCYARITLFEGSSVYDEHRYCASRAACDAYCSAISDRPTTAYCLWEAERLCSSDLPDVTTVHACAIQRTFTYRGMRGSSEPICDPTCAHPPGSNQYDAEFDTLTEYGSVQGKGTSCAKALADLAAK